MSIAKNVTTKIHQKCPGEFTKIFSWKFIQKKEFSWTKLSTRIHQRWPRELTLFVQETSPLMSSRILPLKEYGKKIWICLKFHTSLRCLVFFPAASTSMMHGASYIVHYTIKPIYRQRQFCPSRPMTLDDFSSFYSSTIKARSLETNIIKSKAL